MLKLPSIFSFSFVFFRASARDIRDSDCLLSGQSSMILLPRPSKSTFFWISVFLSTLRFVVNEPRSPIKVCPKASPKKFPKWTSLCRYPSKCRWCKARIASAINIRKWSSENPASLNAFSAAPPSASTFNKKQNQYELSLFLHRYEKILTCSKNEIIKPAKIKVNRNNPWRIHVGIFLKIKWKSNTVFELY